MNRATVERLERINRDFYRERAEEFDRARDRPWQGWERVAEAVAPAASGRRPSVLDAGCGNGRFATFLHERLGGFDYVGVDSSARLLERARERIALLDGVDGRLIEADLVRAAPAEVAGRRFDLVVAFGLLHHVPGRSLRARLLHALIDFAAPGGLVAIAFWQFARHERFKRRFVDWQAFNRQTSEPVDLGQLENGDHLLAWGDDPEAVRYCHWSGPEEIRELLAGAGVERFELYSGRGGDRFNVYALIRAAVETSPTVTARP